ncbi:NPP1 family protein [Streptomyces sp. ITFR-16]|uniref:NPP1 family protein n=1 Tax=Streptomyces sp. ITFR-16 TaxID=3075198 RepID=UPI00288B2A0C|nr:NPP1 family protein [Streptomyces sp. ITFR-16]WNI24695.1 NPP1 family protein [Streptomyces sp. ITFR-16]
MPDIRPARRGHTLRRGLTVTLSALTLVLGGAALAHAAPPPALPGNADELDRTFQPAVDYDKDGCYATSAIGPDGTINPGLKLGGAVNGNCRDLSDLQSGNAYSRSKCDNGWCAVLYTYYFEKDQVADGGLFGGHRHDWEHVVVWVHDNKAEYVATSAHGGFKVHKAADVPFDGTHPKVVYHKDGASTHCFRKATAKDEPPENHLGVWHYAPLVGWNGYPEGLREKLVSADFGKATIGIRDDRFVDQLTKALPEGVPFNPGS